MDGSLTQLKSIFSCKLTLLLVLWINPITTFAQTLSLQEYTLTLSKAENDTLRCEILLKILDDLQDDAGASIYNKQMLAIAEKNLKNCNLNDRKYFKKKHACDLFLFYKSSAFANLAVSLSKEGQFEEALTYFTKTIQIQKELNNKSALSITYGYIGHCYANRGNYKLALENYQRCLDIEVETENKKGQSTTLNNIAIMFESQGNITKALEYHERSLKIREEMGDEKKIAIALNNIALIYQNQGDLEKALDFFNKCLKIREKTNDKNAYANTLNNIGLNYKLHGSYDKAFEYYTKSLNIMLELKNKKGIANSYNNLSLIFKHQNDFDKALRYSLKCLKLRQELKDEVGIAIVLNNISGIYTKKNDRKSALAYSNEALNLSIKLGLPKHIMNASESLYKLHKLSHNHKLALENFELSIKMKDSINNESTRKASIKSQLKYEYEKQAAADSVAHAKESEIKNAELAKQSAEIKAKKNQQYALFGGLGLVMIFAGFMYNRFKVTQKQKSIIEEQKEVVEEQKKLVEEKQKEILDSIHYAQRIQKAHLPSEKKIINAFLRMNK